MKGRCDMNSVTALNNQPRTKVKKINGGKLYYTVEEVKVLLGVEQDKAYRVIRELRIELKNKGYAMYPAGKIPKKYFLERYFIDEEEANNVLQSMSDLRGASRSRRTM